MAVVGFVKTVQRRAPAISPAQRLADKARRWLRLLNERDLESLDDLVEESAVYHVRRCSRGQQQLIAQRECAGILAVDGIHCGQQAAHSR